MTHIPSEFVCELTGYVFLDPMRLPTGETAEKEYLNAWINDKGICPFNRQPLALKELQPNTGLIEKRQRFLQAYPMFATLIAESQYQHRDINMPPQSVSGRTNPSADDLLAMGIGNHIGTSFPFIPRMQGFRPLLADLLLATDLSLNFIV